MGQSASSLRKAKKKLEELRRPKTTYDQLAVEYAADGA